MQMMGLPRQAEPMMTMPQDQLESMYPEAYYSVYPAVQHHCDEMGIMPGMAVNPTKEQLDGMVESIANNVESHKGANEVLAAESEKRQPYGAFGLGGRRFLRDLVGILLIRELLRRRYYSPYGYGGYGYPGGFGYPGFFYPGY
jgi:hypothetical protein